AFATKPLAIVLVPAYLTELLLAAWLGRGETAPLRALARFAFTWIVLGVGVTGVVVGSLVAGWGPSNAVGAYSVVVHHLDWAHVPRLLIDHLALLSLYVLVLPFLATVAVAGCGMRPNASPESRLFAVLSTSVVFWTTLTVAAFGSKGSAGA